MDGAQTDLLDRSGNSSNTGNTGGQSGNTTTGGASTFGKSDPLSVRGVADERTSKS